MRHVKLTVNCLIGSAFHARGAVVLVEDGRAARLVALGHADYVQRVEAGPPPPPETAVAPRPRNQERAVKPR